MNLLRVNIEISEFASVFEPVVVSDGVKEFHMVILPVVFQADLGMDWGLS